MTNNELRELIHSDLLATELADRGDDQGCADRLVQIAPPIRVETILTERGMYDRLGPHIAESVLQKFEGYQGTFQDNIQRVLKWLKPAEGGVDFGDAAFVQLLELLYDSGLGITQQELQAVLSLSLRQPEITADQVSDAWSIYRPDGKVNN